VPGLHVHVLILTDTADSAPARPDTWNASTPL
jgi:hypothetical protein